MDLFNDWQKRIDAKLAVKYYPHRQYFTHLPLEYFNLGYVDRWLGDSVVRVPEVGSKGRPPTCKVLFQQVPKTALKLMTNWPFSGTCFRHLFPAPVSDVGNRHQSSGARNHDALCQQMIPAEKNKDGLRFWEFWKWRCYSHCFSIQVVKKIQKATWHFMFVYK